MASGRNRHDAPRDDAREQHDPKDLKASVEASRDAVPQQSDQQPQADERHVAEEARSWTHEGGMVEQQASAMEWVRESHERRMAGLQHDRQQEGPEQGEESPSLPPEKGQQRQFNTYQDLRGMHGPVDMDMDQPDEAGLERARRVRADLDHDSGRPLGKEEPTKGNAKEEARGNDSPTVESGKETSDQDIDAEAQERANHVRADLARSAQTRDQDRDR